MKRFFITLLFAVWSSVCCAAFPDGWAGYAEATITNPASSLTDFTFIVSLNQMPSDWWTAVAAAGGDLVVTDGSNNRLPVDVIHFTDSGSSGSGLIALKFSPASSGTQKLRIWIGKSGESQPAAGDTYGQYAAYPSSLKAFYPDGGGNDRTSNANNLTMTGSPTVGGASGPINGSKGTTYNGSSQYGSRANASLTGLAITSNLTLMASVNGSGQQNAYIIAKYGASTGQRGWGLQSENASSSQKIQFHYQRTAGSFTSGDSQVSTGNALTGAWKQIGGVYTPSTSAVVYIDGSADTTDSTSIPSAIASNTSPFTVAVDGAIAGGSYFAGSFSMLMVYSASQPAAWIAYHNAMLSDADQSDFLGTWTWVANTPADSNSNFLLLLGSYRTNHPRHHACWGDESKPLYRLAG
jgi:hypothetical protein